MEWIDVPADCFCNAIPEWILLFCVLSAFALATAFSDVIVSLFSFSLLFLSFNSLKLVLFKFVLASLAFVFRDGDFGVANLFLLGDLLFSWKDVIQLYQTVSECCERVEITRKNRTFTELWLKSRDERRTFVPWNVGDGGEVGLVVATVTILAVLLALPDWENTDLPCCNGVSFLDINCWKIWALSMYYKIIKFI